MNETSPPTEQTRWATLGDLESWSNLAHARRCVERFVAPCGASAGYREEVLDFIDTHPDALHRSCLTGHLTGSSWVVDHGGGRGLVLFHTKVQRWLQPGGHADGEANLARVALLEAAEETGIEGLRVWTDPVDVDIHLFVNRSGPEPDHLHLDLRFAVQAPEGAVVQGNHESEELRWVLPDELDGPDLDLDASTRRLASRGFGVVRQQIEASTR
ncbi:MAG: NUDIX hydrolase [Actinomycetia bacterium]|nr:NUDIX hydrolase [Actinomycetes bacterium]MCP4963258.1 NUDIX hydrolase [Actinomycetes bacterium]